MVNKKYRIMDLIEVSGDRDADRASLAIICIMMGSVLSAIVANQSLPGPEIVRFLVVWILSFAPLFFVGYGIADVEKLQALLVLIQRKVFRSYRQRMIQHEAGHFLVGHLLGWPVRGYTANAVKCAVEFFPLSESERGGDVAKKLGFDAPALRERVIQIPILEAPYFSKDGRGGTIVEQQSVFRNKKNYTENPFLQLPSQNDPTTSWPYRGFDEQTIDKLTVVSLAGVCAEILAFGNAEGGIADLSQLRQIFYSADAEMNDRDVDNRIRFGLGFTMSLLRRNLGTLDALAEVMEKDGSVEECVLTIETCRVPPGAIFGDYELIRRKRFREQVASSIERIFLGGARNADDDEDRMVEGKGGGYRKEVFRLTGDDPFYAAFAVSLAFLAWASSGGLSLH